MLSRDATIRGGAGALTYGIPDSLDTFKPKTRAATRTMVRELGTGLLGRGPGLNRLFGEAVVAGPQFNRAVDTVLNEHPGAVAGLLPSLRSGIAAFDASKADQVAAYAPATRTFAAIVARQDALGSALEQAPGTLATANAGLGAGRTLLTAARSLAVASNRTLARAPVGLERTTNLLRVSDAPLARAASLLDATGRAVPDVQELLESAKPVLKPVERMADDATPLLSKVGQYGCDVDNFAENWRSALGYGIDRQTQDEPLANGFIGPLHQFRIIAPFTPFGVQGAARKTPLFRQNPYPRACGYSPGTTYTSGGGQ